MSVNAVSKADSIRARQTAHGELDASVGKLAPGFDLGQVD